MTHQTGIHLLAIGLLLIAIASSCGLRLASQPSIAKDFTAQTINGQTIRLSDYLGKVVVLNFWAIWCPPCRAEMPELEAIYREHREQGLVILAVNVSENSAEIFAFAQELGLTFPILQDSQREVMRAYDIWSLPTTLFIDRQGRIQLRQVGAMRKSFIAQQIEPLLAADQ